MINTNDVKAYAGTLLGEGIALIALGGLALYSVVFATFASVVFFAWLLIFAGFLQFGLAFYASKWSGFFLQLAGGIFTLVAGILVLLNPVEGVMTLTLLLAFLFIAQGILRIVFSLREKPDYWGWLLISGVTSIILGVLILYQWPYSGLYMIGLCVGIDLIFNGWMLVMASIFTRQLVK